MWLRDFLSKDLPCCRTMIYGYNSKLSTHGVDTIMDYGRGLIEELKKVRNAEEVSALQSAALEQRHQANRSIPLAKKAAPVLHRA
jgi:hypothetical protein